MFYRSATLIKRFCARPVHVKRLVKALGELPDVYVLPDGQPAVPLEPYVDASTLRKRGRPKALKNASPAAGEAGASKAPTPLATGKQPGTPLSREIEENLRRFPHCLLLTRVGQFYESYFDQANVIAHLLNIKLTSRKWNGSRVSMCGFPLIHLDKHLKTLVQHHTQFVALCEEFPKYNDFGEKEFERRVTRIVTPGTLIDEPFLNTFENNYLLSIHSATGTRTLGLAWIDVSTGEFFSKESTLDSLQDELARIAPREVVLEPHMQNIPSHPIVPLLKEENIFFSFFSPVLLTAGIKAEAAAISLLSSYLKTNLLENAPTLASPLHETDSSRMQIDTHTIKSLEIKESSYEGGTKGSLVSVIRRTTTNSGSRLLARRLCCPSTSLAEIEGWQSAVAFFLHRATLRADIVEQLKDVADVGRIVQRFILKRGDISNLLEVHKTIDLWGQITKRLEYENNDEKRRRSKTEWDHINMLRKRVLNLDKLSSRIREAFPNVRPDPLNPEEEEEDNAVLQDTLSSLDVFKWSIQPSFSPILSSLHSVLGDLLQRKTEMESKLRAIYAAPSLTLRASTSSSQGMHVHISKSKRDCKLLDSDPSFMWMGESASTKSYYYGEWTELGTMIANTIASLSQAERQAFETLREEVISNASLLRTNAAAVDEIDVAIGFAALAEEMKFVRPALSEERVYHVVNGRHPSVELGLLTSGRTFTPNTIEMTPSSNMHIITGPNMAGKSTALRQTALIAVLAQVGSFVPADYAKIGLIDKLFTRIGARDDLFRDRSTFMVEMLETADILRRATPRSLVIMDEVGRGTTVKDGLAIAFASVHHLITKNQSSCLFATHFHELSNMIGCSANWEGKGTFKTVRFYCTGVDEIDDARFVYSYRLRPGVNRDSHGLKVARLAGLPPSALEVATKTLAWLKTQNEDQRPLLGFNSNDTSEIVLV